MRDIGELTEQLREFVVARDWEQFHTPKNLAMALAGEAGELLAELQWLTPEEAADIMADPQAARQVRSEMMRRECRCSCSMSTKWYGRVK
ncbi:MAG TPA: hypothetical protein VKU39_17070 [Streptosporangiaceae bacterium]|nr:hypothetical protein [Streptosporangiaceae bacterium]